MKNTKSIVGIVALGSMIAGNPIIAKAEEIEKKPDLIVNVETSKEEYGKEEDIGLSLDFMNTSEFNLKDVDITGTNVGDKYVLEGNTKIDLNVGEGKKVENVNLKYIKAEPIVPPGTGDEDGLVVVGVIAIGSALCAAIARKNKKGLIATIVLGAIVVTGVAGSGLTAYAEEVETKQESVVVTKEVVVDGQPLTIELTIGYIRETPKNPIDEITTLEQLSEKKESLMRDYFNGKITQEDYQSNLDAYYEKQKDLDAKKELEELPRTEDGKIDCSSIDPEKIKSLEALDAYLNQDKLDFEEAYKNGIIDENFYNAEMNWIVSYREQFISSKTDSSELQQQEEESIKQKMEQERIEAEQKAEEERKKQEEIKARGELYNLNYDDFMDLWYNIRYNGNTSYTEDQMKYEVIYRWKEGRYMSSLKTEEEVYKDVDEDLYSRYLQENPYAECVNNKVHLDIMNRNDDYLKNVNWELTNRFSASINDLRQGYDPIYTEANINNIYNDTGLNRLMRNATIAMYNWAFAGVKDDSVIGSYGSAEDGYATVTELYCREAVYSLSDFDYCYGIYSSNKYLLNNGLSRIYLVYNNDDGTYTLRAYGYNFH